MEKDYISKSKIKEKIEILKKSMINESDIVQFYKLKYCYEILQELLDEV